MAQPAVEGGDKAAGHQHEDQDVLQAVLQPRGSIADFGYVAEADDDVSRILGRFLT